MLRASHLLRQLLCLFTRWKRKGQPSQRVQQRNTVNLGKMTRNQDLLYGNPTNSPRPLGSPTAAFIQTTKTLKNMLRTTRRTFLTAPLSKSFPRPRRKRCTWWGINLLPGKKLLKSLRAPCSMRRLRRQRCLVRSCSLLKSLVFKCRKTNPKSQTFVLPHVRLILVIPLVAASQTKDEEVPTPAGLLEKKSEPRCTFQKGWRGHPHQKVFSLQLVHVQSPPSHRPIAHVQPRKGGSNDGGHRNLSFL